MDEFKQVSTPIGACGCWDCGGPFKPDRKRARHRLKAKLKKEAEEALADLKLPEPT